MNDAVIKENDMKVRIERGKKSSEKATQTLHSVFLSFAPQVKEFESYGEHTGLMHAIEQGVLAAVAQDCPR